MKRVLAFILVAVMCLTSLPMIFVSASDKTETTDEIKNLFVLKGYGTPNEKAVDGDITANLHFISGNAIEVKEGDVITIAPIVQAQTFQAVAYKTADGATTAERVNLKTAGVKLTLLGDSADSPAILEYTVPAGVTHIAPVGSQMYEESYTVTKNQALTKEICFGMWSDSAMKMFNAGNTTDVDEIVNLFSDGEGGCGVNIGEAHSGKATGLGTNANYRGTKNAIPVTRDDVVYFVGQTPTGGYTGHFVSTFKADGKGIGNLKHAYVSVYADLGNGYVVYAYRANGDTASIRISSTAANYDKGVILVTKNQPFDGVTFRLWCKKNNVNYADVIGEKYVNLFAATDKGGVGIINAEGRSDTDNYPAGHGKNTAYWCTEPIAVTTSDTLYFLGESKISYHVSLFDKDGKGLGSSTNVKPAALTVVEKVGEYGGKVFNIYSYTPAENVGYVRISQTAATYSFGCVLLTKNQPFDLATFKSWCEANDADLNGLLGIEEAPEVDPGEATGLKNLFTTVEKGGAGVVNAAAHSNTNKYPNGYDSNTNYWCTEPISVKAGDVLYFLGVSSIGYHVTLYDLEGKGYGDTDKRVVPADLTVVEQLGTVGSDVYNIYSYTVDENTGYVRISQKTATYNSKCVLLTKNQPFDKAKLKEWCTANGGDLDALIGANLPQRPAVEVDTKSPLYKKSALFIGDSITYGLGEERFDPTLPRLAWAGRLAEKYAMTVVNNGDSGARISKTGTSGFIIDGLYGWTEATPPDMIVMHGGVNDARYYTEMEMGDIDSMDPMTFCGGFNRIIKLAQSRYPNADLFYIANFYIPEGKGKVSNMDEYYAIAKQICDKYGVVFIDLHGNTELNEKLAAKDANGNPDWSKYMPDKLHPNAAGYDIITPYIAAALEDFYNNPPQPPVSDTDAPDVSDTDAPDVSDTNAPDVSDTNAPDVSETEPSDTVAEPTTEEPGVETTPSATTEPAKKSCGGFAGAMAVIAVGISVFGAAITVIKKK